MSVTMNEFALKSYGHNEKLIELYPRQAPYIKQFFSRSEENKFKMDKKLDIFYRVVYKHKNNDRKWSGINNEVMLLEIDTNLSPDFTFNHVDMVKNNSLTISIQRIEQPRSYWTKIIVIESYVDENQELFENKTGFSVETLPGTLAKRLNHYKKEFDKYCEHRLESYLKEGFEQKELHLLSNFTDYLLLKWNEHSGNKCEEINKCLTMYSALHEDCFHGKELEYDYHRFPYSFHDREVGYRSKPPFLFAYQSDMLDEIDAFYKKCRIAFEKMHSEKCNSYWNGSKLKYYEFKEEFLKMWREEKMAKECSTTKMFRMNDFIKNKNTEGFLAEDEKNLYASALSEISCQVGALGNSAMFHHIFKIIRESDYGKHWCFIGRCLYYADKHNNEELIVEIVKYITDWNIVEDCFYHSEKAYSFYDSERDGDVSQILIKYFDYTNLLSKDWIHHDIREILVKQKLHNGLQEKLPEKGTSTFSKI